MKIVLMGAGSISFTPGLIRDFAKCRSLYGSTLALVDIDRAKLNVTSKLSKRLIEAAGADYRVETTTNRKRALRGADFVVVSIERDRFRTWKQDFEIPASFGIQQSLGENGGPGGLMHSLRNIPPIIDICRDMERICPEAQVINFSNPMTTICTAIHRYTNVKFVGLCHGLAGDGLPAVAKILGVKPDELDVVAAGINHFNWILELRYKRTGKDAYPVLRKKAPGNLPSDQLLVGELYRTFGLWVTPSDSHVGEYLKFGTLRKSEWAPGVEPMVFNYKSVRAGMRKAERSAQAFAEGKRDLKALLDQPTHEDAVPIVDALAHQRRRRFLAVNVPNRGYVSNLPDGAVVEVPGVTTRAGVRGVHVGELPTGIAALCQRQVAICELTAQAAVERSRSAALQALLLDPVLPDIETAEKLLDKLLTANARYLPRFV